MQGRNDVSAREVLGRRKTMSDSQELDVERRFYSRFMAAYRKRALYIPFFPTLLRAGLRLKIANDYGKVKIFSRGKEEEIKQWFGRTEIFFGFAIYRSGTAFLATFLDQVVPNAVIKHEANVNDYWYYHLALQSQTEADKYIRNFRLAEIYYRMHNRPESLYGEINPYLRRHVKALQKQLPGARFFHLVRDGRNVVRSLMSRELLDRTDPLGHLTYPPPDDPYAKQWKNMNRFERICWLWQCDNRYLRENVGVTLQFEKLVTDYGYFKTKLTDHIGIDLSEATWREYTHRVGNPTQVFRMDQWSGWSDAKRESFRAICGNEMGASGYDFD
jgi:hypothetical protein